MLYKAKEQGTTQSGSWYFILQDSNTSFHITVGRENTLIYEHFQNPPDIQYLMDNILLLEKKLEQTPP
jgi:hypothetical protein